MADSRAYLSIVHHYEQCFAEHGDCYRGVDWPNAKDAETRYQVMLDVIRTEGGPVSMLDFGCGLGHLLEYVQRQQRTDVEYLGFDISPVFVEACRRKFPLHSFHEGDVLRAPELLPAAAYVVANGVFTERRALTYDEMFEYMRRTLHVLFGRAQVGLAFNVMSTAVDWERSDLFHVPPGQLFDLLTRELSRHVVLRHDYGLYEYTAYVYHHPPGQHG